MCTICLDTIIMISNTDLPHIYISLISYFSQKSRESTPHVSNDLTQARIRASTLKGVPNHKLVQSEVRCNPYLYINKVHHKCFFSFFIYLCFLSLFWFYLLKERCNICLIIIIRLRSNTYLPHIYIYFHVIFISLHISMYFDVSHFQCNTFSTVFSFVYFFIIFIEIL